MKFNKPFSIIEMMTVVMIVLLLMSLMIPTFVNLKMNAKSVICKSQLRQIGVLLTSYMANNGGYLPNDDAVNRNTAPYPRMISDLGGKNNNNNGLYSYWNGHLLPYFDIKFPTQYARNANVYKVSDELKVLPAPAPAGNILKDGWAVVDDALNKGGLQDLKEFICPEIHGSTFDVAYSNNNNGLQVPRVSLMLYQYGESGIPTTYLANDTFFGKNGYYGAKVDSKRMDEIQDISSKLFLVEGSVASAGGNGECSSPYFYLNTYSPFTGGSLIARFAKGEVGVQKLSFVHDSKGAFWVMSSQWYSYYFPSYWGTETWKDEIATKFNLTFEGKAMMVKASSAWSIQTSIGYDIVSYSNPYLDGVSITGGTIFDKFFTKNPPGVALRPFVDFEVDAKDYNYLVGNMNVLFGDGAVASKNNAWLCNNRLKITQP
jgi:type II secretory pathway pseudopilin PulG